MAVVATSADPTADECGGVADAISGHPKFACRMWHRTFSRAVSWPGPAEQCPSPLKHAPAGFLTDLPPGALDMNDVLLASWPDLREVRDCLALEPPESR
jgi:hypothetical protein